ncbi:hypothetical protein GCM10023189_01790 [Nibrella saemangeumensis]|uniref:Beta-lactamase-related domain-containing protein n=1 Tax=Nibrella saemangeumensis TaxID=1084526 RepID=A0ABP8MCU5_9BACT
MKTNRREFLKYLGLGAAGLGIATTLPDLAWSRPVARLVRSTPEAEGIASSDILALVESLEENNAGLHSLMIVRHGKVVAEGWWAPYAPELKHTLYSLSKSFTSTAIGLAVNENLLKVEDRVISFFPSDTPEKVGPNLAAMRIKDLLTMSTGHDKDTTGAMRASDTWIKNFLALPVDHQPGTHFVYNSGATFMLSAILQKITGQTVLQYLTPRLFEPLNIVGATWDVNPQGINTGGWGLSLKTEDIAKFGQLYLQKGRWSGKQLVPEAWVSEATSFQVQSGTPGTGASKPNPESDWSQGYGYQFWRCRHNSYRGDGAYGQYCVVMPEQDAVVAITSETANMQSTLNQIWTILLPAMKAGALPQNSTAQAQLKQKITSLIMPLSTQPAASSLQSAVSGKTFRLEPNDLKIQTVSLTFDKNTCLFKVQDETGIHAITAGIGRWTDGRTTMPGTPPNLVPSPKKPGTSSRVAASGAWTDENTFVMTWRFTETPHSDTVTCRFGQDGIQIEFLNSITAMSKGQKDKRPVLQGRRAV